MGQEKKGKTNDAESSAQDGMTVARDGHVESPSDTPGGSTGIEQSSRMRIIRTVMIVLGWVCMGLYSEITGPTLPYLKRRVNSNYEEIARAMVARSVGYLVGSLSGGFLCEWYGTHVDMWLGFSLALAAVATAVVPWCRSLTLLAALLCTDGLGKGILAAGGNAFMIRMWGIKAAVPVHALHTAFGVGALLSPQIARPFLSNAPGTTVVNGSNIIEYNASYSTDDSMATPYDMTAAAIEYPYSIISTFTLLVATVFVFIFFISPIRQRSAHQATKLSLKNTVKPSSSLGGDTRLGLAILILAFLIFMLPVGMERAYGKFIFSLSVTGPLKLSPADGTMLESTFWASFTVGRLLATIAATRVSLNVLVIIELSVNIIATLALVAYGQATGLHLAIFSALFASAMAPLNPTILSWLNLYIEVTAWITCMAFISSACGAFVYSWMAGYLFQYHGPDALLYFMLASTCACVIIFTPLYLSARKYERGFPRSEVIDQIVVRKLAPQDEVTKL